MSNIHICYGPSLTETKPEDWIDTGYKIKVPYPFNWRERLGKAECDCTEVFEIDRPWMGRHWEHTYECAIYKHLRRYPGIENIVEWSPIIAHTV